MWLLATPNWLGYKPWFSLVIISISNHIFQKLSASSEGLDIELFYYRIYKYATLLPLDWSLGVNSKDKLMQR